MPTLDGVRSVDKQMGSEGTTVGYIFSKGRKVLHCLFPIPLSKFSLPHPHLKQSYPKLSLLLLLGTRASRRSILGEAQC